MQGHLRVNALARRPDGDTRDRFKSHDEIRIESEESALFGTPEQIIAKLETLRDGGVEYVLINFGGSRDNIRRFAREIMPRFADPPPLELAAK
jgi:alkanesulfonate monooxygenase SsuD/methylene tetrahydromethanopterin reductase-like flavin-dependent oxidoreductase (luciferase family)